jgi:hypothetical protein
MKYVLIFLLALPVFAKEAPKVSTPASTDSEFQLDKNLVNKLYEEALTERERMPTAYNSGFTLAPSLSYFSPTALTLENDYFRVPYAEGLGSTLGIYVMGSSTLVAWGGLHLVGVAGVGYSMKEAPQKAISKTGDPNDNERSGVLTLHHLPLTVGTKAEYAFSSFSAVRPYIGVRTGAEWLYQTGKLDGVEQGFWIPFYEVGAGLVLFDTPASIDKWFGGMVIDISKHQSILSNQSVAGWQYNVGINVLL